MIHLYDHSFSLPSGKQIFVPTGASRRLGSALCALIERRWRPPSYFFHFQEGGHVAAAAHHLPDEIFLRLDLEGFFDAVSRTKVHRALRKIGVPQSEAYSWACCSTIRKAPEGGQFVTPFGFVQSVLLASLALHFSELGRQIIKIRRAGVRISVYVDDIVVSAKDFETLGGARRFIGAAAAKSGFKINERKSQGPAAEIEVFNLRVRHGEMVVAPDRFDEFRMAMNDENEARVRGIIGYVRTVNLTQAKELEHLRALLLSSRH